MGWAFFFFLPTDVRRQKNVLLPEGRSAAILAVTHVEALEAGRREGPLPSNVNVNHSEPWLFFLIPSAAATLRVSARRNHNSNVSSFH